MASRVLVVDDEPDISGVIRTYLEKENYQVAVASRGREALDLVDSFQPDLVLLDIMLPDLDGLSLCRELRRSRTVPILMLSARGDDVDKIIGLEVGADDYLAKPFNPKELVARVRALLRRVVMAAPAPQEAEVLERGSLVVNLQSHRVLLGGQEVHLTPIEFSLLKVLAAHPGHVLGRQDLLNRVWGPDFFGDERTVDVHIRNLRSKLRKVDSGFDAIQAVWGVGYRFD